MWAQRIQSIVVVIGRKVVHERRRIGWTQRVVAEHVRRQQIVIAANVVDLTHLVDKLVNMYWLLACSCHHLRILFDGRKLGHDLKLMVRSSNAFIDLIRGSFPCKRAVIVEFSRILLFVWGSLGPIARIYLNFIWIWKLVEPLTKLLEALAIHRVRCPRSAISTSFLEGVLNGHPLRIVIAQTVVARHSVVSRPLVMLLQHFHLQSSILSEIIIFLVQFCVVKHRVILHDLQGRVQCSGLLRHCLTLFIFGIDKFGVKFSH